MPAGSQLQLSNKMTVARFPVSCRAQALRAFLAFRRARSPCGDKRSRVSTTPWTSSAA